MRELGNLITKISPLIEVDSDTEGEYVYNQATPVKIGTDLVDSYWAVLDRNGNVIRKFGMDHKAALYFAQGYNHLLNNGEWENNKCYYKIY